MRLWPFGRRARPGEPLPPLESERRIAALEDGTPALLDRHGWPITPGCFVRATPDPVPRKAADPFVHTEAHLICVREVLGNGKAEGVELLDHPIPPGDHAECDQVLTNGEVVAKVKLVGFMQGAGYFANGRAFGVW